MKFATYFDKESYIKDTGTFNKSESLTDQSFQSESDINVLAYRYLHGLAPRTPVGEPKYDMNNYDTADWTFEDWQNQKAMIERRFLHLTPEMRAYFGTAQEFLKYCSNPENYELTEAGMKEKPDEPLVPPVQVDPVPSPQPVPKE